MSYSSYQIYLLFVKSESISWKNATCLFCFSEHQIFSLKRSRVSKPQPHVKENSFVAWRAPLVLFPVSLRKRVQECLTLVNIACFGVQHSECLGEFAMSRKDSGCAQEFKVTSASNSPECLLDMVPTPLRFFSIWLDYYKDAVTKKKYSLWMLLGWVTLGW